MTRSARVKGLLHELVGDDCFSEYLDRPAGRPAFEAAFADRDQFTLQPTR